MGRTRKQYRAAVREELGDRPSNPALFTNDDQIDRWVDQSVRRLDEIRPLYTTSTITPQSGTTRYAAPAGMIRLDRVAWLPSSRPWDEQEYAAVYEPHKGEIHLTGIGRCVPIPSGEVLTVEHTKRHLLPTRDTASDINAVHDDAVIYFAAADGALWLGRQLAAGNRGVVEFTRGRYSEKGGSSIKVMADMSKGFMNQANEILGRDDPAVVLTKRIRMSDALTSPGNPRSKP